MPRLLWRAVIFVGGMAALGVGVHAPLASSSWIVRLAAVAGLAIADLALFWIFTHESDGRYSHAFVRDTNLALSLFLSLRAKPGQRCR